MSADLGFIHRWEPGDRNGPTLLLLHGTGGTEHDLIDLGRSLAPTANLLSPRGQVSERGMNRFFRRLAEGVFDLDDLARRTGDLRAFVAQASPTYGFDPAKVVAVGFSNGANIAGSLVLSGSRSLAGAVLLAPMVPFVPDPVPDLGGIPVFVGAGRNDPLVPEAGTEHLVQLLTAGGAAVETFWHPGGHNLTRAEVDAAKSWLEKHFYSQGD
jgi:phospholipase/carboxylesterase